MQEVKAGKIDETGQSLNKVEKVLGSLNIKLRDSVNEFRPMEDVIADVASQWDNLSSVQKAQVSNAIAGQRQAQIFTSLMQNWGDVTKYVAAETDSAGLAQNRYAIYLKGVEAAQNRLRASWEGLWQTTVSSGMITDVYDLGAGFLSLLDRVGGLKPILMTAITSLIAFNGTAALSAAGITSIATAWKVMSAAILGSNPIGWIVLGLGAATLAFNYFYENASEKLSRLNKEMEEHGTKIASLRDNAKSIRDLTNEYDDLINNEHKTKEESQRLLDVQNKLKELVPTLSGDYDEYGNYLLDATNDMKNLTAATLEQIEAEKKLRQAKVDDSAESQANSLLSAQRNQIRTRGKGGLGLSESEKMGINLDWTNVLAESKAAFSQMSVEAKKAFLMALEESGANGAKLAQDFRNEWNAEFAQSEMKLLPSDDAEKAGSEAAAQAFESFTKTLEALVDNDDTINNLFNKSITEGLGFSDIASIPEEYLDALTIEGDKIKLNIDLIREKQIVEAETSLDAIKLAYERGEATLREVEIIQLYVDKLREQQFVTVNGTQMMTGAFNEMAWSIANDAAMSGNSFVDLQGKALTSAQSIYQFLSSGDAAFNSFIQQAASILGISVEAMATKMHGIISNVVSHAVSASSFVANVDSPTGYGAPPPSAGGGYTPIFTPAPVGQQFPGGLGGSGGGGGSTKESKAEKRKREKEERERKLQSEIDKAQKEAEDSLKKQLKGYKDIIDARKELLDSLKEERNYQQDVEEQNKNILKIQNELAALQFDDSEEGKARRLELQDELNDANKELENLQYDRSVDLQKDALDAEYEALEARIENAIDAIQNINATSMSDFAQQLANILSNMNTVTAPATTPTFHDGGIVGGSAALKSNEMFAKVMKGEGIFTSGQMDRFINKTLPQMVQTNSTGGSMGDITINIPVNGSLDKQCIPDLKKTIYQALNDALSQRGIGRRADAFSL
jgi:hypothetical protein